MYIALVGGVIFILIQVWLLIFFARSLGNKITHKITEGGNRFCWYGGRNEILQIICKDYTHMQQLLLQSHPAAQYSVIQLLRLELWCSSTYSHHGMVAPQTKFLSELTLFCVFYYRLYLH